MKVKSIPKSDKDIIQKFSKFIIAFDNTFEFIKYIKTNNFRVEERGLELFIPKKYQASIKENLEFFNRAFLNNEGPVDLMMEMDEYHQKLNSKEMYEVTKEELKRLLDSSRRAREEAVKPSPNTGSFHKKYPNISNIFYQHLPLVNKKEEIRLIPLDRFLQMLNQEGRVVNKDQLLEEMKLQGHYFIYWNKETMYFDFDTPEIDVEEITIYRKYIGFKKRVRWGEPHIKVKGLDGKKRDINQEAISYFQETGLNAIPVAPVTIKNTKMITKPFLDDNRVARIFRKEDVEKILMFEKREKISDCFFVGFPDLFVWDNKGKYFFVEVKSQNDKLQKSQLEWLRWNKKEGKFGFKILNIYDTP